MIHVMFFTLRCLKCSASFFNSIIFFLTTDLRSAWSNLYFSSAVPLSNSSGFSSSSSSSLLSLELYCNCISGVTLMSSKLYSSLCIKSPVVSSEGGKAWAVYTLKYKIFLCAVAATSWIESPFIWDIAPHPIAEEQTTTVMLRKPINKQSSWIALLP